MSERAAYPRPEVETALGELREMREHLFDPRALGYPERTDVIVEPIRPLERSSAGDPAAGSEEGDLREPFDGLSPEGLERSDSREGGLPSGTDVLAVYRPFHFYPRGHWGVLFFEDAMLRFIARLSRHLRRCETGVRPVACLRLGT